MAKKLEYKTCQCGFPYIHANDHDLPIQSSDGARTFTKHIRIERDRECGACGAAA